MLQIAKILKSNGTEGEVLAGFRGIDPEDLELEEPVFINFDELPVPFFIQSLVRRGNDKAILRLNDVNSLRDAEELVGRAIFAEIEEEDDDEPDFVGWKVLDKGRELGEVSDYEPIPGNLCLYVDTPQGQIMVPLHEDFIIDADPEALALNLDLPEGLY